MALDISREKSGQKTNSTQRWTKKNNKGRIKLTFKDLNVHGNESK